MGLKHSFLAVPVSSFLTTTNLWNTKFPFRRNQSQDMLKQYILERNVSLNNKGIFFSHHLFRTRLSTKFVDL